MGVEAVVETVRPVLFDDPAGTTSPPRPNTAVGPPPGETVVESVTLPMKLFTLTALLVEVLEEPRTTVSDVGLEVTAKSGAIDTTVNTPNIDVGWYLHL